MTQKQCIHSLAAITVALSFLGWMALDIYWAAGFQVFIIVSAILIYLDGKRRVDDIMEEPDNNIQTESFSGYVASTEDPMHTMGIHIGVTTDAKEGPAKYMSLLVPYIQKAFPEIKETEDPE